MTFRSNKSLPFCSFDTRGISVDVAAKLDDEEQEDEEEEGSPLSLAIYVASGSTTRNFKEGCRGIVEIRRRAKEACWQHDLFFHILCIGMEG
jgi:hypothetical protein